MLVPAIATIIGFGYYYIHNQTLKRIGPDRLRQILNVKTYKALENLDLRFGLYRSTIEIGIKNLSILGSGTKTFGYEVLGKSKITAIDGTGHLRHYNTPDYKAIFNAHNALLTIWIEMGWVGLIAVLTFLWLWLCPEIRGPPLLMMPMLAVCVGQILDYFVWEIFFMAFQSFFLAHFAATIAFEEKDQNSA